MAITYRARTVRLPEETDELLRDLAALWGCSASEAVIRAIRAVAETERPRLKALRRIREGRDDPTPKELEQSWRAWQDYLEGRDPGRPLDELQRELAAR